MDIITNQYHQQAKKALDYCLEQTDLSLHKLYAGKVRDCYALDNKLLIITTDRQSAFDRKLALIPFKGQVLNQCSAWWFKHTRHIIDNHYIDLPDPNAMLVKKCQPLPIEIIVRGYITGSTNTSLWTHYQQGERCYCGNSLPDGLQKNQRLPENIITPTTKSSDGDVPISGKDIVAQQYLTANEWQYIQEKALALFQYGQTLVAQHGLILVDTKYEFGKDEHGNIVLIDELHTPDSSRYWLANSYQQRIAAGEEPENIDKEFLRLWFVAHCNPYHDEILPPAPPELIIELSVRYIQFYEMITGERFNFPDTKQLSILERIAANLSGF
ncbi:MAG: phosphoribosylaminoimidazolesuccinocarboxamide synthase [Pseudomonadota bacterium]